MDRPLIMMSSVTNAMRGREILRRHGISSEIERTPRGSARQGCGYSLYVKKTLMKRKKYCMKAVPECLAELKGEWAGDIS